jgi:hypothetical protein
VLIIMLINFLGLTISLVPELKLSGYKLSDLIYRPLIIIIIFIVLFIEKFIKFLAF